MENSAKDRRRLLINFSNAIRDINRAVINPTLEPVTLEKLKPVMQLVAEARATYLSVLFAISSESSGSEASADIAKLRSARERYEELVAAANALETMIERGYLDVSGAAASAVAS